VREKWETIVSCLCETRISAVRRNENDFIVLYYIRQKSRQFILGRHGDSRPTRKD